MFKNISILIITLTIVAAGTIISCSPKLQRQEDISKNSYVGQKAVLKITDGQIMRLLKENKDSLEYITKYPDFKIEAKTLLTKESILSGQEGPNFKEVYQGLSLQDNRYLRVDLADATGLITAIDTKTGTIPNVFGVILIRACVNPSK